MQKTSGIQKNNSGVSSSDNALLFVNCNGDVVGYKAYLPPKAWQKSDNKEITVTFAEAYQKACWFIDGGDTVKSARVENVRLVDWEQDEIPLFAAINDVAKTEVRALEYLHWWTFLSYYISIREGLFAQIINIRSKNAKRKKLEKWENEFYKANKEMIDLKKRYSAEQQAEIDRLNRLLD